MEFEAVIFPDTGIIVFADCGRRRFFHLDRRHDIVPVRFEVKISRNGLSGGIPGRVDQRHDRGIFPFPGGKLPVGYDFFALRNGQFELAFRCFPLRIDFLISGADLVCGELAGIDSDIIDDGQIVFIDGIPAAGHADLHPAAFAVGRKFCLLPELIRIFSFAYGQFAVNVKCDRFRVPDGIDLVPFSADPFVG